jgi:hypothetical protein
MLTARKLTAAVLTLHLRWLIGKKVYNSGKVPAAILQSAGDGDFAILTPPPSKSDPFDMVWGDKPIWLPFDQDPLAAFTALAEIELNDPLVGAANETALFTGNDAKPLSGSQLDSLLSHMLLRHYDERTAKLYSWHSARIWLCCTLAASGCPRHLIQAMCRWQTDESITVYTCLGAEQYSETLKTAMATRIDGARAATLADAAPFIDLEDLQRARAADADALEAAGEHIDDDVDDDDDDDGPESEDDCE